jgi:hypothetical protein
VGDVGSSHLVCLLQREEAVTAVRKKKKQTVEENSSRRTPQLTRRYTGCPRPAPCRATPWRLAGA